MYQVHNERRLEAAKVKSDGLSIQSVSIDQMGSAHTAIRKLTNQFLQYFD